jgi:homoserine dehydrogenase
VSAPIVVLKLGSSVLPDRGALGAAVQEIYRHLRRGKRVVAVVSAVGRRTDELLAEATSVTRAPEPAALAALLATGERAAVALLALALAEHGLPAYALAPEGLGLRVAGSPLDAEPIALDPAAIRRALDERPVLVVPGFVGLDERGGVALLGRGGSDLSALFLARALDAERCLLLKDVDGLYERDPALSGPRPRRFRALSFDVARRIGGGVVQPKALDFAARHGLVFDVGAPGRASTTRVGAERAELETAAPSRRLRVALAGLGTVGGAVLRALQREPERFELVGAASTRFERAGRALGVARELWRDDGRELLELEPDVLVELTGAPAAEGWIRTALARGIHVVTAHKELLARAVDELEALASAGGARLGCSAAVGGALPALEAVERIASRGRIRTLAGVLNATSNLVLDLAERGASLDEALAEARRRGLAEADAARDLDGRDAAAKLALLARAAFGVTLDPRAIPRVALDEALLRRARRERERSAHLRLVARARRDAGGVRAELTAAAFPAGHPLAAEGVENRLLVTPVEGEPELLVAAGAGGAPTALSVLADLADLARLPRQEAASRPRAVRAAQSVRENRGASDGAPVQSLAQRA